MKTRKFEIRRTSLSALVSLALFGASGSGYALETTYKVIEKAADGAKVTTVFTHGQDQTIYGSPPSFYGYYVTDFPSMNDFNDVVARVPAPGYTSNDLPSNNGEAAIWRGDGENASGTRQIERLGIVYCPDYDNNGLPDNALCSSRAVGVNNYGYIVGSSHGNRLGGSYPEKSYAYFNGWIRNSMNFYDGQAYLADINDKFNIIGNGIHFQDYTNHGTVRIGRSTYTIGEYSATDPSVTQRSLAHAINYHAEVTGQIDLGGEYTAFYWKEGENPGLYGELTNIGTLPGGRYSVGFDINDDGVVVGYSETASSNTDHAFKWSKADNTMVDLDTLGGQHSYARSINNAGVIVGHSLDSNGNPRAVAWDTDNSIVDLNTRIDSALGWTLVDAYKVNEHGEILVRGMKAGENKYLILTMDGLNKCRSCKVIPDMNLARESLGSMHANADLRVISSARDDLDNTYMVSYFASYGIDLDPGVDVRAENQYRSGTLLQKIDKNGDEVWSRYVKYSYTYDSGSVNDNITLVSDGLILWSDRTFSKWSFSGEKLWSYTYSGGAKIHSVKEAGDGHLYLSVYQANQGAYVSVDVKGQTDTRFGKNLFVIEVDEDANFVNVDQWSFPSTWSFNIVKSDISLRASGGYYIAMAGGTTDSTITSIDTAPNAPVNTQPIDATFVALMKIDGLGALEWSKTYAPSGTGYISHMILKTSQDEAIYALTRVSQTEQLRVFDSAGALKWETDELYSGYDPYNSLHTRVNIDPEGSFYYLSQSKVETDLDPTAGEDHKDGGVRISKINADGIYAGSYVFGFGGWNAFPTNLTFANDGSALAIGKYQSNFTDLPTMLGSGFQASSVFIERFTPELAPE